MKKTPRFFRQFFHLLFGLLVIFVLIFFGQQTALAFCIIVFFLGLALSHLIKNGAKIALFQNVLKKVEKESEKNFPGFGALVFFFGIILALFFSPKIIVALGAISILVFGDASSNIIGNYVGRIQIGQKYTVEGTIGGITVSFLVLATFLEPFTALLASVIAMLSEFLPFEDNISIPVTGVIVLSLLL